MALLVHLGGFGPSTGKQSKRALIYDVFPKVTPNPGEHSYEHEGHSALDRILHALSYTYSGYIYR